ncbi:hypothetical protein ABK040_004266 [Willaertia magna]
MISDKEEVEPISYNICLTFDNVNKKDISEDKDLIVPMQDEYVLYKDKFQFVKPYKIIHKTPVRQRWLNRTLFDIMQSEFKVPNDILIEMIEQEQVKLIIKNKKLMTSLSSSLPMKDLLKDYKLQSNDMIEMIDWKNEKPVLYKPKIKVLYQDDTFIVIDKPSSYSVHPGGRYVRNTLDYLLEKVYKRKLYLLHRLDKVTSGVLIQLWNSQKVKYFQELMKSGKITKCYLAQVYGEFPFIENNNEKSTTICIDGNNYEVDVNNFIHVKNSLICKHNEWNFIYRAIPTTNNSNTSNSDNNNNNTNNIEVNNNGENTSEAVDAFTMIKRVYYNKNTDRSIVLCLPITGRTHQIREHTRILGHAIIEDIGYDLKEKSEDWENPWISKWDMMKRLGDECHKELLQLSFDYHDKEEYKEGDYQIHLHAFYYYIRDEIKNYEFCADLPPWAKESIKEELSCDKFYNQVIEYCKQVSK